ncbi:ATP synthase subunit s protein [Schistosoma japonicum]|uniref:ATP synthase, H+ transporting, mitochondrial F0 complex, subunit s n=1 Tax=Schistosoma japonicum TaxID=6182 RepID=C1L3X1_SCHJA|nr:ATP synthase subunit s protein [Schistosoma japonicum]CAX69399.1 ATP synthase, H+ transporting, mitochondrial F0 complex, subunit s [Schistosoma japonicum]
MLPSVTIGRLSHSLVKLQGPLARYVSSETADKKGESVRSVYCKSKYMRVVDNKKPRKICTGLVGESPSSVQDKILALLQKIWDMKTLNIDTFKTSFISRMRERNRQKQLILDKDIGNLGLDIAVAYMICRLGGRFQLVGSSEWIQPYAGTPPLLPREFIDGFLLETIDLSGTNIVYEGLEFLLLSLGEKLAGKILLRKIRFIQNNTSVL